MTPEKKLVIRSCQYKVSLHDLMMPLLKVIPLYLNALGIHDKSDKNIRSHWNIRDTGRERLMRLSRKGLTTRVFREPEIRCFKVT